MAMKSYCGVFSMKVVLSGLQFRMITLDVYKEWAMEEQV